MKLVDKWLELTFTNPKYVSYEVYTKFVNTLPVSGERRTKEHGGLFGSELSGREAEQRTAKVEAHPDNCRIVAGKFEPNLEGGLSKIYFQVEFPDDVADAIESGRCEVTLFPRHYYSPYHFFPFNWKDKGFENKAPIVLDFIAVDYALEEVTDERSDQN